ncbi:hypothetical protein EVC45_37930 [Paraburkholderia sp. UYCP14C]|uniref:hypothetical protein n=1 Tax=Paraburkholderia sp. UYCP14C TaxID=2511130 RepID=UPI001020B6FA|nr:hypothetical protein [Paraburkholderia sp. UYCP14C]RZF24628.1 hypothetical protein EVC45_37930 [Paraburkholderia sp. UYCP14C]
MPGNACSDFFAEHAEDNQKVKALQKIPEALAWEGETASDHSPGVVKNEELIVRQVMHPNFFDDEKQKIKPIWFDDVTNRGFSSDRLAYTTVEEVIARAKARADERNAKPENAEKPPVTVHSLGKLPVSRIREVICDDARAFGVYDTARADNISHTDVCQLANGTQKARSIRYELYAMTEHVLV